MTKAFETQGKYASDAAFAGYLLDGYNGNAFMAMCAAERHVNPRPALIDMLAALHQSER